MPIPDALNDREHRKFRQDPNDPNQTRVAVVNPDQKTLIDEPDANTTYIGAAKMGASTSDAVWQITKISISGTVTTFAYADGDDNYDNIWDNRTELSYS